MPTNPELIKKLHPQRFKGISGKMSAIVGYILGLSLTNPEISDICITSDNHVLAAHRGDIGCNDMLGSKENLEDNWQRLLEVADLTEAETLEAQMLYNKRVHSWSPSVSYSTSSTKKVMTVKASALQRIAMPVPISEDIRRRLPGDNLAIDPAGNREVPGLGKTRMRAINENLDPTLPTIGRFNSDQIRSIHGQRYIILDVWKDSNGQPNKQYKTVPVARNALKTQPPEVIATITPTAYFPGTVRVLNLDSGLPERFTYDEIEPVLREAAERISRQTMDRYNQAVRSYNRRIDNIGPATSNLTVLPLQLRSLEDAVRHRIENLNGMIAALQARLGERTEGGPTARNTPQVITDWEAYVDSQISGGGLEERDFIDAVIWRYAYRYDELLRDLRQGQIPMPHGTAEGANPNLQNHLEQVALAAYEEHLEDQLEERFLRQAGPGINPYETLASGLESNQIQLSQNLSADEQATVRRNLAGNARAKARTWTARPGFDISRQDILGTIPEATQGDFPVSHAVAGHANWASTSKSDYAAMKNCERDRDELTVIADGLTTVREAIARLPEGQRGNFLSSPEGQPVLDRIEQLANTHLRRFTERYSPNIVDPATGQLDKKYLLNRTGGEGNAYVAVILSRAFKILATTLNRYRPGPGGPGGGGTVAEPAPAPAAPVAPVEVSAAAKALFLKTAQVEGIKQTKPFSAIIPQAFRQSLKDDAEKTGVHRGVFFDTSGKARVERINPNAQYNYVFRTDGGAALAAPKTSYDWEKGQPVKKAQVATPMEELHQSQSASKVYKLTFAKWAKIGKLAGWDKRPPIIEDDHHNRLNQELVPKPVDTQIVQPDIFCPKCGETVWDKATLDQALNKCWKCGQRFLNDPDDASAYTTPPKLAKVAQAGDEVIEPSCPEKCKECGGPCTLLPGAHRWTPAGSPSRYHICQKCEVASCKPLGVLERNSTGPSVAITMEMPADARDRLMELYRQDPEAVKKHFRDIGFPLIDIK